MPYHIALLIHALHGGGAERLMSQLAARWVKQYRLTLITWAPVATDCYALPNNVTRIGLDLAAPSRGLLHGVWANIRRMRRLRRELRRYAPDMILSFSDQMNIVTLEAARGLKAPTWISEHSDPAQQRLSPLWERWRRRSYPNCTGCVALTDEIADYMSRWIPRQRLRVIPPAISPPDSPLRRAEVETTADVPQSRLKTVLFVGRLSGEKAIGNLIQAWSILGAARVGWQLLIAGDGPQREQLQEQASRQGEAIQFLGWVADPWPLYAAADLFVLPSDYEGFPVVLLEAMTSGTPVISTRCTTAISQLLRHGPCLVDVPVGDVAALADGFRRLLCNADLRSQLALAGQSVAQHFRWEVIGPLWDALLESSLTGRSPETP